MSEAEKKKKLKLWVNIFTVGAMLALTYIIRDQIIETIQNIGRVNYWALLLMIPLQIFNYDMYARMYRRVFAILGSKTTYKDMYKVTLELTFVNHVFPSGGVSGFSYFGLRLKNLGVSPGKATLVQMFKFILLFVSFELLLFIGLLSLAIGGQANGVTILVASSLATFLLVGTIGAAFIIGSKRRINAFFTFATRFVNRMIHFVRPKHPETISIAKVEEIFTDLHDNYMVLKKDLRQLIAPLAFAFFANLSEVLTIYVVYIAFGHLVNPGAIILAYAFANFAGLISVLPGGVGIYEAIMTAVLATAGVPPAVSIPVTVMYRILNMTMQIIPGYYFYHKAVRNFDTPVEA